MNGPTLRNYKAGSIIYFIEDRGNEIFVLQKGRIVLISQSLDLQSEVKEEVQKGEFFGVKSSLGIYPREETAQVLTDSTVLVFNPPLFQGFCMKNSRIVLQMLKVFSGELRKVHRKVREILGESGEQDSSVELLSTAEYYFKTAEIDHARYAFNAFIKHFAQGELIERAQKMLSLLESGQPYPLNTTSIEDDIEANAQMKDNAYADSSGDSNSFSNGESDISLPSVDDIPGGDFDMSDGDDLDIPDMDIPDSDLSIPDMPDAGTAAVPPMNGQSISDLYYDGLNEFSQQNWSVAIERYEQILKSPEIHQDSDAQFVEKSHFELGRTYLKTSEKRKALEKLSEFVKKYQRSALLKKAMLLVAEIYETSNDKPRAIGIYQRITKLPPKDKETTAAKHKLEQLG